MSETDYEVSRHLSFEDSANIRGMFHNGPLTTIRYAGVVGLVLFYALMIGAAVSSVKCVRRCRGTPLLPVAIFLAVQLIWTPVHFTFIYGAYDSQVPEHLFLIGLLTLVWRMSERRPPSTEPAVVTRPFSWNNGGIAGFRMRTKVVWLVSFPILSLEPEVHVRERPATGHVAETWVQCAVVSIPFVQGGVFHDTHLRGNNSAVSRVIARFVPSKNRHRHIIFGG